MITYNKKEMKEDGIAISSIVLCRNKKQDQRRKSVLGKAR